jgi:class II lanthipeptide synthase
MLAETSVGVTQDSPCPSFPLPQSEESLRHGLAGCLVAAAPMIQRAREYVRNGARELATSLPGVPFDPQAIEEKLAVNLLEPLASMMSRVCVLELNVARLEGVLEGNTSEERFVSFLNRLREPAIAGQLFAEYPVLKNEIEKRLEQWSVFSLEFLKHLCEDWQQLLRRIFSGADPGEIASIQGGAGDTHCGGRSVMIITFAGGERIVYKPRSLAADEHFQQLLDWINSRGDEPAFRLTKILDRGDHGWVEFISASPCRSKSELSRFYRRQGSYLALLYAMEACDFHHENLVAAGEHPILVDLEALFHPRVATYGGRRANEQALSALDDSVLAVGMLPIRIWANGDESGVDISGLSNSAGQLTPFAVPQWDKAETDEMRVVRKRAEMAGSNNCPTLDGIPASAFDYAEEIAGAFASTYRLLLAHAPEFLSLLHRFANDEVRAIPRSSRTYANLYHESFHPDLLRDRNSRESFLNKLQETVAFRPNLQRLLAAEQEDLLRGDIPLFTTHPGSCDVWTSAGQRIADYFTESGISLVERRISHLSEKDLQLQHWIVRASIASMKPYSEGHAPAAAQPTAAPREAAGSDELIAAARQIGDRLMQLAFGDEDDAAWIGLVSAGEREWHLSPLGLDFYDGVPGVILFLAYLAELTGESRYASLAKAALKTLRTRMKEESRLSGGIGAFSGWGGIIYMFAHLGVLWQDTSLFSEAEELASSIADSIAADPALDVIGGAAGCALALLALYKCRPSQETLKAAIACGEHLLGAAQKQSRGIGWNCMREAAAPLTGFAHGNAGIGYALLALYGATRQPRFQEAAALAFDYERSVYSSQQRNWPDLRNKAAQGFAAAWCHGAPGIGLSRLCALGHSNDPQLSEEIEAALATTAENITGDPTLCHGDLGNADILLYASETLQQPCWRNRAAQFVTAALHSARGKGWKCSNPLGVESPGLMTGLAGIGYALLRHAAPARVPSILALEAPVL